MCFCSVNVYWNDNPIFVDACAVSMVKRKGLCTRVDTRVAAMFEWSAFMEEICNVVLKAVFAICPCRWVFQSLQNGFGNTSFLLFDIALFIFLIPIDQLYGRRDRYSEEPRQFLCVNYELQEATLMKRPSDVLKHIVQTDSQTRPNQWIELSTVQEVLKLSPELLARVNLHGEISAFLRFVVALYRACHQRKKSSAQSLLCNRWKLPCFRCISKMTYFRLSLKMTYFRLAK